MHPQLGFPESHDLPEPLVLLCLNLMDGCGAVVPAVPALAPGALILQQIGGMDKIWLLDVAPVAAREGSERNACGLHGALV